MNFLRKHPILFNLILIAITAFLLLTAALWALDAWTGHGKEQVVPDVANMPLNEAVATLHRFNLNAEVVDSVHNDAVARGCIVDQVPPAGDKVKPGRDIYLTINAFSPKRISVPDLTGSSARQAVSMLRSLGFINVDTETVPSDYKDLVLAVKSMGVSLYPGTMLPVDAPLTVEVGSGYDSSILESDTLSLLDNAEWEQTELLE